MKNQFRGIKLITIIGVIIIFAIILLAIILFTGLNDNEEVLENNILTNTYISDIPIDQKIRIVGIIDACKNSPDKMESYLEKKVNNKEISDIVSFTIKECLKTDDNI